MFHYRLAFPAALAFITVFLISCNSGPRLPKGAEGTIPIKISRFDKDFFALDTNNLEAGLKSLEEKYPDFYPGFLTAILGIAPQGPLAHLAVKSFLTSYLPVYRAALPLAEKGIPQMAPQIEQGLQWMRYLVPSFRPDSPFVVTTFIGPMDAFESFSVGDYGDVRTANGVGVALQLHLGEGEPIYQEGMQSGVFFNYQVRRFTKETVPVNAMKNIIDDLYPYQAAGKTLVEEMVEKGKRIYLLKRVMPNVADSLLIGYTGNQFKGCFENEATIWGFFVKNDLLFSIEPSINQQYIKDGPKTPELGDASPGYIGLFTGWRIVEAFMGKRPKTTIEQLMGLPAAEIFQASGYKP